MMSKVDTSLLYSGILKPPPRGLGPIRQLRGVRDSTLIKTWNEVTKIIPNDETSTRSMITLSQISEQLPKLPENIIENLECVQLSSKEGRKWVHNIIRLYDARMKALETILFDFIDSKYEADVLKKLLRKSEIRCQRYQDSWVALQASKCSYSTMQTNGLDSNEEIESQLKKKDTQIRKLHRKVSALEIEFSDCEADHSKLLQQHSTLSDEFESLRGECKKLTKSKTRLETTIEENKQTYSTSVQGYKTEIDCLKRKIETFAEREEQLLAEAEARLKEVNDELHQRINEATVSCVELQNQLREAKNQNEQQQELERQLSKLKSECNQLQKSSSRAENQINSLTNINDNLKAQIAKYDAERDMWSDDHLRSILFGLVNHLKQALITTLELQPQKVQIPKQKNKSNTQNITTEMPDSKILNIQHNLDLIVKTPFPKTTELDNVQFKKLVEAVLRSIADLYLEIRNIKETDLDKKNQITQLEDEVKKYREHASELFEELQNKNREVKQLLTTRRAPPAEIKETNESELIHRIEQECHIAPSVANKFKLFYQRMLQQKGQRDAKWQTKKQKLKETEQQKITCTMNPNSNTMLMAKKWRNKVSETRLEPEPNQPEQQTDDCDEEKEQEQNEEEENESNEPSETVDQKPARTLSPDGILSVLSSEHCHNISVTSGEDCNVDILIPSTTRSTSSSSSSSSSSRSDSSPLLKKRQAKPIPSLFHSIDTTSDDAVAKLIGDPLSKKSAVVKSPLRRQKAKQS